jgi:hypothetical protein
MMSSKFTVSAVPATWGIGNWPVDVWPFTPGRARSHLLRDQTTRDELASCGALTRPAQHLVFIGAFYLSWLQKKSSRVSDFEIAPNRERNAAARESAAA